MKKLFRICKNLVLTGNACLACTLGLGPAWPVMPLVRPAMDQRCAIFLAHFFGIYHCYTKGARLHNLLPRASTLRLRLCFHLPWGLSTINAGLHFFASSDWSILPDIPSHTIQYCKPWFLADAHLPGLSPCLQLLWRGGQVISKVTLSWSFHLQSDLCEVFGLQSDPILSFSRCTGCKPGYHLLPDLGTCVTTCRFPSIEKKTDDDHLYLYCHIQPIACLIFPIRLLAKPC